MPVFNMTDTLTCDNCPGRTDLSVAVDLGSVLAGQQRGLRAQAHHPRHVEVGRYCRVVTSFSIVLCKLEMSILSSILPYSLTTWLCRRVFLAMFPLCKVTKETVLNKKLVKSIFHHLVVSNRLIAFLEGGKRRRRRRTYNTRRYWTNFSARVCVFLGGNSARHKSTGRNGETIEYRRSHRVHRVLALSAFWYFPAG